MIIAEIGWNFLGNLDLAKKMIKSAHQNGCKHVKFQLWDPKNLKRGPWDKDGRREIYNKAYLSNENYFALYKYCKLLNIDCFASVFSTHDYERLKEVSNKLIKIPSLEAYDLKIIKKSLNEFETVILSTGALRYKELKELERFSSCKNLIVLHCVSIYPLNHENSNFAKFFYLKKKFKRVGYSGHCSGIEDALFAISNGAICIEKHFTTNQKLEGRDNKFAILPKELNYLCNFFELKKKMMIDFGLDLQDLERDIYKNYRGRWKN